MSILTLGDSMPEFTVNDQNENPINTKDLLGKKLIFFFYPKANTPGCTAEACNLRDGYATLKKLGYEIYGVSADKASIQKKFETNYQLPFTLLADTEHQLIKGFGVWGPKKFMGKTYDGIYRTTFVVNENGIVTHRIDNVETKQHDKQLLELIV